MSACSNGEVRVASYHPEKYSAHGLTTYSANVSGANVSTRATRLCRTASSRARGRGGSVRSHSVSGAPRARKTGATMVSSMCCTMCTLSSVVS